LSFTQFRGGKEEAGYILYDSKGEQAMAEKAAEYAEPRFYSREFKLEAVRLSETSEKSVAQIARELGISDGVLYRWRRQLQEQPEQAFPGKGHQSELEEENWRLRRELERVQQERDILKKAIAIFLHS
jgi:transposase